MAERWGLKLGDDEYLWYDLDGTSGEDSKSSQKRCDGYDWHDSHNTVDISEWTNDQDSKSNQKRSDIISKTIKGNKSLDHLVTILESGWNVNEVLNMHGDNVCGPMELLYYVITTESYLQAFEIQKEINIVQLLLKHGADPNLSHRVNIGNQGEAKWVQRTALQESVSRRWTEVVEILLDAGAKCTTFDAPQNPLVLALQNNDCHPDLIELLLKHGADPNHHEKDEDIPLALAIYNYNDRNDAHLLKIVRLLLEHGANPNVLHWVDISQIDVVEQRVQRTPIHEAASRGWTDGVKMLLDAGAKCMMSDGLQNILILALHNPRCRPDLINLLLKNGADSNQDFPLIHAITKCMKNTHFSKIVQLLLDYGADPNLAHRIDIGTYREEKWVHRTALHEAAKLQWTEGVKILLDAGAKCITSDALQNPLALALQERDCPVKLIELLLKHDADPNDHDDQFENIPLMNAIGDNMYGSYQDDQINPINVQLLLEHGANPTVTHKVNIGGYREDTWVYRTALQEAARRGWMEGAKMLLDAGAKCTTSDASQNLLALALHNRDCQPDLIKLLLKHGADPNDHDDQLENIPLLNCRYGPNNTTILQLLLQHGANPNVSYKLGTRRLTDDEMLYRSALYEAASRIWTEGVKMLLDAGAKCKMSGTLENPLALALQKGSSPDELIKLLLKHGADPNAHDDQLENIPLMNAIRDNRYGVDHDDQIDPINVQLLLEHGANPNVTYRVNVGGHREDKWLHETALHVAARKGWTEVVEMLLDAGAKCTMSDDFPNPLALALLNLDCHPDLIELLLKHGADPNYHKTDEGIPLPLAIHNTRDNAHRSIIVQLLLEHGANPNVLHWVYIRGYEESKWVQRTPIHEAASQGWTDGVKMLLDAGAKCSKSVGLENSLVLAKQSNRCSPDLLKLLLLYGTEVNYIDARVPPLIHTLSQFTFNRDHMFLQQQLDLFFLHGGNINIEDCNATTALQYVTIEDGHCNNIRWLIRHGAELPKFGLLKQYFVRYGRSYFSETPLMLVQAGMRVSHAAQKQLSNISTWLQDDNVKKRDLSQTLHSMWDKVEEAEQGSHQGQKKPLRKSTFTEYWTRQMVDLKEFSDESLHVYPEITRQEYEKMSDQFDTVLDFLSQPLTLQWHCRRCVRENLVSLQPSVVTTLPIPSRLKCYILCHEI